MRTAAQFVRLALQSGKTAVFLTHHLSEAMEIGDRVPVCHRPARIASEAHVDRAVDAQFRRQLREKILEVLAIEPPAPG